MPFDHAKESVMLEFRSAAAKAPGLAEFRKTFNVAADEADPAFGIIPMERGNTTTYLANVTREAGERIEKSHHPDFIQLWANPQMSAF